MSADATPVPEKGTLSAARTGNGMSAADRITVLFIAGFLFGVIGAMLAIGNWPGVEVGYYSNDLIETGNEGAAYLGLFLAGVGQICLMIAIIAWGVRLGTQAAKAAS